MDQKEKLSAESRRKKIRRVLERAVVLSLLFSLIINMADFGQRCRGIENKVLRLHILANSDDAVDQTLKLKVREEILLRSSGLLDQTSDREEAEKIAAGQLPYLRQIAEDVVQREGYDYTVQVELTEMYFPTRTYEAVTLPAGKYHALRITIGEGKGKNWWCVLFPPMCLSACRERESLDAILSEKEAEITKQPQNYKIQFKLVEWWQSICRYWQERE